MVEIRKAYPTDAYALVQIRDQAWKDAYYDVFTNDIIVNKNKNVSDSVRHLEDQINENNRIFVAVEDSKVVGFVFYAKTQGDHYDNGEIREIYVLPEYQKRGIGKQLFEKAVDAMKTLRFTSFIVACPLKNRNMDFFIHLGGVKKGNKIEKIFGYSLDCEVIYYTIGSGNANASNQKQDDWNELYLKAQDQLFLLNDLNTEIAVLLADSGHMYLGIGIKNKVCPIESALSNMYLGGDKKIVKILILNKNSNPVLPCGKCRDLLIHLGQQDALILFDYGSLKTMTMRELNPYYKDAEKA